jgi:hypothetical protein
VALVVSGLATALGEREELIAHVEEGHSGHPAAQLELEHAPVELERRVEVAHLERHVVDADEPRPGHRGLDARPWRAGQRRGRRRGESLAPPPR